MNFQDIKVGDKVRNIGDDEDFTEGGIYKVLGIDSDGDITVDNPCGDEDMLWSEEIEFPVVPREGDYVRALESSPFGSVVKGQVFKVLDFVEGHPCVGFVGNNGGRNSWNINHFELLTQAEVTKHLETKDFLESPDPNDLLTRIESLIKETEANRKLIAQCQKLLDDSGL